MDGMGAQARKTARVESLLAWRDRHYVFPTGLGEARARATIPGVRYVITLDADTHLPRGAAAARWWARWRIP